MSRVSLQIGLLVLAAASANATVADVTTGVPGTILRNQGFGPTRAVEVTVLGDAHRVVASMTLREFNIGAQSSTVGARIYDDETQALLASVDADVTRGHDQTITLPISATLLAGHRYQLAFFVPDSGDVFGPIPKGSHGFPYTEAADILRIEGATWNGEDEFPRHLNAFVPMITVQFASPDSYALYQTRRGPGVASFRLPKQWIVQLNDVVLDDREPDDPENHEVVTAASLLFPALIDQQMALRDNDFGYLLYRTREGAEGAGPFDVDAGGYPPVAAHARRIWSLENQLGTITVASNGVGALLVPTTVGPAGEAPAPTESDETHFLCYDVSITADPTDQTATDSPRPKLRKDLQVFVGADRLGDSSGAGAGDCAFFRDGGTPSFEGTPVAGRCLIDVRDVEMLCNPVNKTEIAGDPPRETVATVASSTASLADEGLLCYRGRLAKRVKSAVAAAASDTVVGQRLRQARSMRQHMTASPSNGFPTPLTLSTRRLEAICLRTSILDVESDVSVPRFVDNGDGTVADTITGLQWEKKVPGTGCRSCVNDGYQWTGDIFGNPNGTIFTEFLDRLNNTCMLDETVRCDNDGDCSEAGARCGLAGHRDWRLPTVALFGDPPELETILDRRISGCAAGTPCIDPIFGPTGGPCLRHSDTTAYWSATTRQHSTRGWVIRFGDGQRIEESKGFLVCARAVRNGATSSPPPNGE